MTAPHAQRFPLFCAVTAAILLAIPATAQQPAAREFPVGDIRSLDQLPATRLRVQLDTLPPQAQARALQWLQNFHFTEHDLPSMHADRDGGIFYVCDAVAALAAQADAPAISEAAVPITPLPPSLIFHSKPGAPNVLYLNFSGENVINTAWNNSLNRSEIPAVAFSTDSDFTTFSDAEQLAIKRVWQRVAEDYAPFNIDVTTERPATFGTRTAHALITRSTDANGAANPSSSGGGVAYINVFGGASYANYRPAWVYYNNLASTESYIAEAASHEIGHNLGLSHDGQTGPTEYYGGHGSGDISWGPIMGTGYNRNVSQWCKGDYYQANNTQDDLGTISTKLSYRADDHGNTAGTATPLVITSGTNILSTTPENDPANTNAANKGVFDRNSDIDVFSFVTGSGPVNLSVRPWVMASGTRGGNLDILLQLFDQSGALVLSHDPPSQTVAQIQTNLPAGRYYVHVRNSSTGDPFTSAPSGYTSYGALGQYFISGYVSASTGLSIAPTAELDITNITQSGAGPHRFTVTYSDDQAIDVLSLDGSDIRILGPNGYDRNAQFVSVDTPGSGTPRTATYSTLPPNTTAWAPADNGTYTVWMRTNQVRDAQGTWVARRQLGQFEVAISTTIYTATMDANPGWSLEPQWEYGVPSYANGGPTTGFTGTHIVGYNLAGNYANNLTPKYATTPAIHCAGATSLTLRFQRWLGLRTGDSAAIEVSTNDTDWISVWSTTSSVSDSSWQYVEYALPSEVIGSSSVRLRWVLSSGPSQVDIGWNIDDVELLATGNITPARELIATVNNPAWGSVTPTNATYPAGSTIEVVASPGAYYAFTEWSGDVAGTNNPLTVSLNTSLSIVAVFGERLTTNHPTPLWWLAAAGYTNNFENAVSALGANGLPLWQSYVAGLDPRDPTSQLRLVAHPTESRDVLSWTTVTDRLYTVSISTNLSGGFTPLVGASDLPASVQRFTNSITTLSAPRLYRLQVRKP
jgi:hypothetical protein